MLVAEEEKTEKVYRIEDIAKRFGVTPKTVYSWVRNGELIALHINRNYTVSESDLQAFIEERKKPRPRKPREHKDSTKQPTEPQQ